MHWNLEMDRFLTVLPICIFCIIACLSLLLLILILQRRWAVLSSAFPFLINAITGGTDNVIDINRKLAQTAKSVGAAIAVGSQYGAVKSKSSYQSFKVVREVYPNGVVFANVSALATPDEAAEAVKMLDADALQVHLNPAQELVMPEGDRNFKGLLDNMRRILEHSEVPVIVKETGCGMAAEQIKQMLVFGFTWFDIGGAEARISLQ